MHIHPFERALARHRPVTIPGRSRLNRACTAILLSGCGLSAEILLIRRARRKGDPWSGHISLPGGKMAPGDRDGRSAAARELLEETGINAESEGRYLGRLSDLLTRNHHSFRPMVVTPHVFQLDRPPSKVKKQEDEVDEIFRLPVSFLLDGNNRKQMQYPVFGARVTIPCYDYDTRRIWGLTLIMLDELTAVFRNRKQNSLTWAGRYLGRV